MSLQKKVKRKRKAEESTVGTESSHSLAAEVAVELAGNDDVEEYTCDTGNANLMVIDPNEAKKKKKKVKKTKDGEDADKAEKKLSAAAEKRRAAIKEKRTEKVSKTKRKKLAAIVERKKKKLTQEELLAELSEYRLDDKNLSTLASTAHRQDKVKKDRQIVEADTSVVARKVKVKQRETIHNKEQKQENYYETDSETGEDEEGEGEEEDGEEEVVEEVEKAEENAAEAVQDALDAGDAPVTKTTPSTTSSYKRLERPEDEEEDDDAVLAGIKAPESTWLRKPIVVKREEAVQTARSRLPIFAEEQVIVEAINDHTSVVVCGETGSGKTTQIPQMLYEAGYTTDGRLIGVTEPRRVAAVSMARRVGEELGDKEAVSYQIRYEGTRSENTRILFMTDGVLMKEMSTDIMLKKYSVIIIDEAHERSLYSDVLIGLLSRVAPLRAKSAVPLKLIIMSATLRLDDFLQKRLFPAGPPRVLKVEARQYPVTVHFDRKTPADFLKAAFRKTCRIHETLPEGGILIFVPGQRDVQQTIAKLAKRYPVKYVKMKDGETMIRCGKQWKRKRQQEAEQITLEEMAAKATTKSGVKEEEENEEEESIAREWSEEGADVPEGNDLDEDMESDEDQEDEESAALADPPADCQPLFCLPLYSLLSAAQQRRVFDPAPEGTRLCIVATNVAETSLTIPGIKYVVDSGFEKRRRFDPVTGVSQFIVARISQASSDQRAGRAGRVRPGHAYRLYSSAVFTDLEKFSRPEILDKPADQLVLHLKSMNIIKVANFPFPSAPPVDSLVAAEERLIRMGALQLTKKTNKKAEIAHARISPLGRTLAVFPLAPAYAKVLALANQHNLLPHAIQLIAALSVREPLVNVASIRGVDDAETKQLMTEALKRRRAWCGRGLGRRLGDLLILMKAVTAAEEANLSPDICMSLGVRPKAMMEIRKLRQQLTNVVNTSFASQADVVCDRLLKPPDDVTANLLRQMMTCGLADRIARRVDRSASEGEVPRGAYQTQKLEEFVFIDATSMAYTEEPDYVLYQEIIQISEKKCMQTVMTVDAEWLVRLCEPSCTFGDADSEAEPSFDNSLDAVVLSVPVDFGPLRWGLGRVNRPLPVDILHYRHFARLLLAGEVIPALSAHTPRLLAPPSTMVRSWAKLQPRTEQLLNALVEKEVRSRKSLLAVWEEEPSFLMNEYLLWLPEKIHDEVQLEWPPIEETQKKRRKVKR